MVDYLESAGRLGSPFKIVKTDSFEDIPPTYPQERRLKRNESSQILQSLNR
jgi:hypothetical protein